MSVQVNIRRAAPQEMGDAIAIDEDAFEMYKTAGVHVEIGPDHPFAIAEWARWTQAARDGGVYLAEVDGVGPVGMLVVNFVDGLKHLEQLSVRRSAMRRGIGCQLLRHAIRWAGAEPLWLTTYSHLPWNRRFYEQEGFVVVPEAECPRGIVAMLQEQRRWLAAPQERVAMCRSAPEIP